MHDQAAKLRMMAAQKDSNTSHQSQGNEGVESLLEELVGVLDVELDQYRDLLDMLYAGRGHFAMGDIRSFQEISERQETAVLKIKTLEQARRSIVGSLAQYFDIPHEGFTLAKLATLVDSPYSEQCAAYQRDILALIGELEGLRESSVYPIQHALHYDIGILRIFASARATDFPYSNSDSPNTSQKRGDTS